MTTTNVPSDQFDDLKRDVEDATRYSNSTVPYTNRVGQQIRPIPLQAQDIASNLAAAEQALANSGFIPKGDFTTGGTVEAKNEVFSDGADYWRYDGALPFIVTAGSSPTPTGVGAWINVSDGTLRSQLAAVDSSVLIGGVEAGDLISRVANVKDFGAVGDGVTDDSAPVLTAIEESNGKPVYFPRGEYLINSITVNAEKMVIFGDGHKNTAILGGIAQNFASGTELTVVSGISFIAQNSDTANCIDVNAGVSNSAKNITVRDCYFESARRQLNINCSTENVFIQCNVFKNCGSVSSTAASSILVGNSSSSSQASKNIHITNNVIDTVICGGSGESHGIIVTGDDVHISNNTVKSVSNGTDGNGAEAIYAKCTNFTISNNTIFDGGNGQGAICLKGNARGSSIHPEGYDGVVSSNIITFSGIQSNNIGVYCFIENVAIHDNVISNCSAPNLGDISFGNSASKCFANDNKIINSKSTYAIALDSTGGGHSIINNIIDGFDLTSPLSTESVINVRPFTSTVMRDLTIKGNKVVIGTPSSNVTSLVFVSVTVGDSEGLESCHISGNSIEYPLTNVTRYYFLRYSATIASALPLEKTFLTGNTSNEKSLPAPVRGFGKSSLASITGTTCTESYNSWQFASAPNSDSNYYSVVGSIFYDVTPTAGGFIGSVCVTEGAGSSAVFKNFGAIEL